ncbi:MAG: hypothetical protein Q8R70_12885, partial [Methanoregula sp.]|nr:hypothetical protein [Methanoregula sp.]
FIIINNQTILRALYKKGEVAVTIMIGFFNGYTEPWRNFFRECKPPRSDDWILFTRFSSEKTIKKWGTKKPFPRLHFYAIRTGAPDVKMDEWI